MWIKYFNFERKAKFFIYPAFMSHQPSNDFLYSLENMEFLKKILVIIFMLNQIKFFAILSLLYDSPKSCC